MEPGDVKHSKFKLLEVLYDNGEYTVAWGVWEAVNKIIAQ